MRFAPAEIIDYNKLRPPTDVMAITSLPIAHLQVAGGSPRWQVAGLFNSAQGKLGQHAVLTLPQGMHYPDTRYSILDTLIIPSSAICHRLSPLAASPRYSPVVMSSVWSWKRACALSA